MDENFSIYNGEGTILRVAQLRMLTILLEIDKICKRHSIPYWLDYGTLLGSVRHKGFIPWDDDLDISCLKKDYRRLKKYLVRELPKEMVYQDWRTERKLLMKMGKIRDLNSYFEEELYERGTLQYQGIYIDIFPLIKVPSARIKRNIDFFYGRSLRRIRGFSRNKLELIIAYFIYPLAVSMVGASSLLCYFKRNCKITTMYGSITNYAVHSLDDIFPLQEMEFEEHTFSVPNKVDKYLADIYNDYLTIPPQNQRIIHATKIEIYD